jgi:hypothetical protein
MSFSSREEKRSVKGEGHRENVRDGIKKRIRDVKRDECLPNDTTFLKELRTGV